MVVLRIPGPFAYFQEKYAGANGDTIRAHISEPATHAEAITALADELDGDDKRVAGQIEGDIETGARTNAQTASKHARTLAANGRFAVGLLTRFAEDVDTFDATVNDLNVQVDLRVLPPLMKQKAAELRPRYQQAEGVLDTAADDVARMFKGGATAANVRQLIRSGAMPLSTAKLYPDLRLTDDDKAAYYRALALQKQMGDAEDAALKNPALAWLTAKVAGFQPVPGEDGLYTTNEHSIQSYLGFHDAYDDAGKHLGMDLDDNVVEFPGKDGKQFRLELWKGSYGNGSGFGGEVGLYTRGSHEQDPVSWAQGVLSGHPTSPVEMTRHWLEGRDSGYYSTAQGEDQIQVTQTISDKNTGEKYFTYDGGAGSDGGQQGDHRHFWNLAIKTDPGHTKQDLVQSGEIRTQDRETADAMFNAMKALENDPDPKKHLASVTQDPDGTIHYTWDK